MNAIITEIKGRMTKSLEAFQAELGRIRTGRANSALLDDIRVECYGSQMPLNQVATIGVPESRLITLSPYDKSLIGDIEKAILKSGIGLQPNNDGKLIRIPIPTLTEERRRDIVKHLKKIAEDARIIVRNIRRDGNEIFKAKQKSKEITEDDLRRAEADVQKMTDEFIAKIESTMAHKEKEIMEV